MKMLSSEAVKKYDGVTRTKQIPSGLLALRKRKGGYDILLFKDNVHGNHDVDTVSSHISQGKAIAAYAKRNH